MIRPLLTRIVAVDPLLRFQSTILSALTQPAEDVQYKCPSGACTWPEYSSSGICNSCEDISQKAQVSCSSFGTNLSWIPSGTGLCTYTISNDWDEDDFFWTLWVPYTTYSDNSTTQWNSGTYTPSTSWNTTVHSPFYFGVQDISTALLAGITNMAFEPMKCDYTTLDAVYDVLPNITQCRMNWCSRNYTASYVENGILYDNTTSSAPIYINPSIDVNGTNLVTGWMGEQQASVADLSRWVADPAGAPEVAYFVDDTFFSTARTAFADALNYTYYLDRSTIWDGDYLAYNSTEFNALNTLLPSTSPAGGDNLGWSQQAFEGGNSSLTSISATLDNVALALTNLTRQSPNATLAPGSVHRQNTFVRVRWLWFI